MVNAWSLLHSELNGTMDEDYPIMSKNDDVTILGGDSEDTIIFTSDGVGAADTVSINFDEGDDLISFSSDINFGTPLSGGMGEDHISFGNTATYYVGADLGDDPYPTIGSLYSQTNNPTQDDIGEGYKQNFPSALSEWERIEKPQPNLKDGSNQKYQEDKGIADLKSYVASTYKGHYTNENSDVQTLDLIHSVGDAESFCRSNALKYLSRYDKKGSAKNDILKAMHYCLLLYYFSGNTQEPDYTNTRYETF